MKNNIKYLTPDKINQDYNIWFTKKHSRKVQPINFNTFVNFLARKYKDEYKNIESSVSHWRRNSNNFFKLKNIYYIDEKNQPELTELINSEIRFRCDKLLLSELRINDSLKVKKRGAVISNINLLHDEKIIVEKHLIKSNSDLFKTKYAIKYFRATKDIKDNFKKIFDKYEINAEHATNIETIKKLINEKIEEIYTWHIQLDEIKDKLKGVRNEI